MKRADLAHQSSIERKPPLDDIHRLTATVEAFCVWTESLPSRELRPRGWGPREVLAHLVYWHEGYVRRSAAVLAGKAPSLPTGRFSEINAQAVARLRGAPIRGLLRRFRIANRRMCRLASVNDPRKIVFRIKSDSRLWKLSDLIPAAEGHIRNHLRRLKKENPAGRPTP